MYVFVIPISAKAFFLGNCFTAFYRASAQYVKSVFFADHTSVLTGNPISDSLCLPLSLSVFSTLVSVALYPQAHFTSHFDWNGVILLLFFSFSSKSKSNELHVFFSLLLFIQLKIEWNWNNNKNKYNSNRWKHFW